MARAWANVDLDAVVHNVTVLRGHVAPARFCAVVKADGYGHGSVAVSRAALAAGADWLAVAQVPEAVALRDAGIDAPLLVLSEPRHDELDVAVGLDARITVYTPDTVAALTHAADRLGLAEPVRVHLKVDTGMRRVGVEPDEALSLAKSIAESPRLELEGVFTHFPVADEASNDFTAVQVTRLDQVVEEMRAAG